MRIFNSIIESDDGLTLMELIIAIALFAIVSLAAFQGMHFAFNTLDTTDELNENIYLLQRDMEENLSHAGLEKTTTVITNAALSNGATIAVEETLYFDWETGSGLADFKTLGVTIQQSAEGGSHLDETVYVFIPVNNTDQ